MAAVENTSKLVTTPLRYTSLLHRRNGDAHAAQTPVQPSVQPESYFILSQELFAHTLFVERKRTERSGRSFVLMLLESSKLLKSKGDAHALDNVLLALSRSSRDTDTRGWFQEGSTIGVIYTELGPDADGQAVSAALLAKVTKALSDTLTISQINEIRLTFHMFPENWDEPASRDPKHSAAY